MILTLALALGSAVVGTPSSASVGGGRSPVALSVSPARIALGAPASRTIELRNLGAERVVVDVARTSVGRRVETRGWVSIRPAHLALRAGSRAVLTLRVRAAQAAQPGDHRLRVLLIARPQRRGRVAVLVRLGIGVRVRMPGRVVRRLDVRGLRVRRGAGGRALLVSIGNRGNVTEQLRGRLTVTLKRSGRVVSRLRPQKVRELLPRTRTVLALPYVGHVRGVVTAIVKLRIERLVPLVRRYRLRL
jgi:hypothetical protein